MNRQRAIVAILVLAAAGLAIFLFVAPRFSHTPVLSGYVEGEALYPAAPLPGRITAMNVKRGDVVKAGQALFTVDTAQSEAQLGQAAADLEAAKALAEDARKGQRPAELGVIQAELAAARAAQTEAERNLGRIRPLVEAGAAAKAQLDQAVASSDTAAANVRAVERKLQAARLGARTDQVQAADERVRQAEAAVSAASARLSDMSSVAPAAGRIEDVYFQQGEWAPGNQPLLSLIPDGRVRLRFFVPEKQVALYTTGKQVSFGCDGCAADLVATISYVSPRPEFTPPVIYSREARDRMVFLVEAQPAKAEGLLPGLPIDVEPLK